MFPGSARASRARFGVLGETLCEEHNP